MLNQSGWVSASHQDRCLLILAGLLGFSLPVGTMPTNVLVPLLSLTGLYMGRRFLPEILRQPVIWFALLIFAALGVGVFYSDSPNAVSYLLKYRKVLSVPLLAMFFLLDRKLTAWLLGGFLLGNVLTLVLSTYVWLGDLTVARGLNFFPSFDARHLASGFFKNAIAQSLLMALAGALSVVLALRWKFWRVPLLVLAGCLFANDLLMSPQRTGYLAILILAGWGLLALLPGRAKWPVVLIGIAALCLVGFTQNPISARVGKGLAEVQRCVTVVDAPAAREVACNSSMGLRTYFYTQAAAHIKLSPWLGHGTGSLGIPGIADFVVANAHNEYLMQGVQTGLLGVALFTGMLISGFLLARRLTQPWAALSCGVVLTYATGSLFNSFLLDITEGNTLIVFLAVLLSTVLANRPSLPDQG